MSFLQGIVFPLLHRGVRTCDLSFSGAFVECIYQSVLAGFGIPGVPFSNTTKVFL